MAIWRGLDGGIFFSLCFLVWLLWFWVLGFGEGIKIFWDIGEPSEIFQGGVFYV